MASTNITVSFVPDDLTMLVGSNDMVNLTASKPLVEDAWLNFSYEGAGGSEGGRNLIRPLEPLLWHMNMTVISVLLTATSGGHMYLGVDSNSSQFFDLSNVYLTLNTNHVSWLDVLSNVIGWIYFVAWTISFWPQVFLNFYRKSVVGLNFDFLTYNFIGFACYTTYNCVLYFSPVVQQEYFESPGNQRGGLPVTLQDICFSIHAVVVILLTIFQTLIFDRGQQRVSWVCRIVSSVAVLFMTVSIVVGAAGAMTWLLVIQFLSYVKLASTLIKYIPQAWMNFRRQSTVGWSIWNVLLDFTGGVSSLTQMFILAYNYDDWVSFMGNPTKFALGAFSVLFDILFIVQHYCLYRDAVDEPSGTDSLSFSDDHQNDVIRRIRLWCCPGALIGKPEPPLVPHVSSDSSMNSNAYSQIVDNDTGPNYNTMEPGSVNS